MSLVRFKTGLEDNQVVESMTVFNSNGVDTKKQPMFFGQPLGIQRYDSYKYPIFEKLTTQQQVCQHQDFYPHQKKKDCN